MKHLFFILAMTIVPIAGLAKSNCESEPEKQHNEVKASENKVYDVYLAIIRSSFSSTIRIDIGNSNGKDDYYDENGKKVEFNSTIDAVDYFSVRGWEVVTGMGTLSSDRFGQYYLMRKTLPSKADYEAFKLKHGLH